MTVRWRERMFPASWSTRERIYVAVLWAVIVVSVCVLIVMGVVLYSSLQQSGGAPVGS